MKITIIDALIALRPRAEWSLDGEDYSGLTWLDKNQTKPTEEEINAKVTELSNSEPMKLLREERNKRLSETDWPQLPDTLVNAAVDYIPLEQAWKDYGQYSGMSKSDFIREFAQKELFKKKTNTEDT